MRRFAWMAALASAAALAACGTPQQRCISAASKDLRIVTALIAQLEEVLERGYDTRMVPYTTFRTTRCYDDEGEPRLCRVPVVREREKVIAVDLDEERRKLESLRVKQAELIERTAAQVAQCRATYPE